MIELSTAFQNDNNLKRVFSWQARVGLAPKFGTRPISWYQIHHCHVIDILMESGANGFKVQNGMVCGRYTWNMTRPQWRAVKSVNAVFDEADKRSRV